MIIHLPPNKKPCLIVKQGFLIKAAKAGFFIPFGLLKNKFFDEGLTA